jgi:hypothetical protein
MEKVAFIREHPGLIEELRRSPHHPEEKVRVLQKHADEDWEDWMFIWALEECGEEDVVIEIIAQHLGWGEDRVQDALMAAGWPPEKVLRVYFRSETDLK